MHWILWTNTFPFPQTGSVTDHSYLTGGSGCGGHAVVEPVWTVPRREWHFSASSTRSTPLWCWRAKCSLTPPGWQKKWRRSIKQRGRPEKMTEGKVRQPNYCEKSFSHSRIGTSSLLIQIIEFMSFFWISDHEMSLYSYKRQITEHKTSEYCLNFGSNSSKWTKTDPIPVPYKTILNEFFIKSNNCSSIKDPQSHWSSEERMGKALQLLVAKSRSTVPVCSKNTLQRALGRNTIGMPPNRAGLITLTAPERRLWGSGSGEMSLPSWRCCRWSCWDNPNL